MTEIIVVGGGVNGCSVAYHLALRGARVTLLERRSLASAASGASAGGVRQQGRDSREMPFAIESIARWATLEDELDADLHYYREGHVKVIEDAIHFGELHAEAARQRALGLDIEVIDRDQLRSVVPHIAVHTVGGIYTQNDGHANPILTTHAFAAAAERHGATIRTGVDVTGIAAAGGRVTGVMTQSGPIAADVVVVAAGAWSNRLIEPLGIDLPVIPMGLQMIATTPLPEMLEPVVLAHMRKLSLKQLPSGNFILGGGWPGDVDLDRAVATGRLSSVTGSLFDASIIYPPLRRTSVERIWYGIEALAFDEVPILGPLPGVDNLVMACGFSGHGFAISPSVGKALSELIVDGAPRLPLEALGYDRFLTQARPAWAPAVHAG